MNQLIFGDLLSTHAPRSPIIVMASIAVFCNPSIMVGPAYEGRDAPALGDSKNSNAK